MAGGLIPAAEQETGVVDVVVEVVVAEAQVVGVPDERLSEVACACIIPIYGQEISAGSLMDYCRGKLASFKLPRHVLFMEGYPMTPSGKVQKFKLRELAEKKLEL